MEYKFIVNTENVNSYGYRIITGGIDTTQYEKNPVVLFMHNRGNRYPSTGDEVIGKARVEKEGDQLLAYIEFDSENEFASKIESKVKGGFIRMCSMYADVVESSSDEALALPAQKYETITKCKLIEISIVDIGGNDDAIRLSASKDNNVKLKLLEQKQKKEKNMDVKTIALALGKPADASENDLLNTISELKLSQTEVISWKKKYNDLQNKQSEKMVDKAVSLGLIPEVLKEAQVSALLSDFEGQSIKLAKLIEEKEIEIAQNTAQGTIGSAVSSASSKTKSSPSPEEKSFDFLQKNDPIELARIREQEPQQYSRLVKNYTAGVRYVK